MGMQHYEAYYTEIIIMLNTMYVTGVKEYPKSRL